MKQMAVSFPSPRNFTRSFTLGVSGGSGSGAESSEREFLGDNLFLGFLLFSRWNRNNLVEALMVLFFEEPGKTSSSQS